MSLLNLYFKKNCRGFSFCDTRVNRSLSVKTPPCNEPQEPRDKVSVLYVILRASTSAFVCSVRKFCLQFIILLFAACWSFVCSVRKFCLQLVILLIAACIYFFFVCSIQEMNYFLMCYLCYFARNFFICSVFSLLKRWPLWATLKSLKIALKCVVIWTNHHWIILGNLSRSSVIFENLW